MDRRFAQEKPGGVGRRSVSAVARTGAVRVTGDLPRGRARVMGIRSNVSVTCPGGADVPVRAVLANREVRHGSYRSTTSTGSSRTS
jgi:hypothetical protein